MLYSAGGALVLRVEVDIYVSRLGEQPTAELEDSFRGPFQPALDAIPDTRRAPGYILPTPTRRQLDSKHKGAAGAYNMIEGDWDGSLDSGASGWVVIDRARRAWRCARIQGGHRQPYFMLLPDGDPDQGDGLKSVELVGTWRCDPSYSAAGWDRWVFRRLYWHWLGGGHRVGHDLPGWGGVLAIVEDCVGSDASPGRA